ncbi:hypothetical protein [Pseudacidovorax sp. RU35E]|uniref:hypothetical protein n=1 Tax=Pseudacidovorax sp. RU35E TaxID=1907403 RepID=UPI001F40615D|nr:hypothetical protein [Pseudacidovorax sp. RU35E]
MTALRRSLIALALLVAATAAPAMSLREFRTLEAAGKEGPNYASYYLVGVVEGLRESAEATQRSGQKPPFCVAGRRLEPAMARSLFQGELARNAQLYEADMPVQLVLSAALQSAYRCAP